MKDIAIQSPALWARSTSVDLAGWSISPLNYKYSASCESSIHMCGISKRDVMYLTVNNSESDLEESDTAVLRKRHYHLHVNLQIHSILEGLISNRTSCMEMCTIYWCITLTSICILIGLHKFNQ